MRATLRNLAFFASIIVIGITYKTGHIPAPLGYYIGGGLLVATTFGETIGPFIIFASVFGLAATFFGMLPESTYTLEGIGVGTGVVVSLLGGAGQTLTCADCGNIYSVNHGGGCPRCGCNRFRSSG